MSDKSRKSALLGAIGDLKVPKGAGLVDPFQVIVDYGLVDETDFDMPDALKSFLFDAWEDKTADLRKNVWSEREAEIADKAFENYTEIFYLMDAIGSRSRALVEAGLASDKGVFNQAGFEVLEKETKLGDTLEMLMTSIISKNTLTALKEAHPEKFDDSAMVKKAIGTIAYNTLDSYGEAIDQGFESCTLSTSIHPTREAPLFEEHLIQVIDYYPPMVSEALQKRLDLEAEIGR